MKRASLKSEDFGVDDSSPRPPRQFVHSLDGRASPSEPVIDVKVAPDGGFCADGAFVNRYFLMLMLMLMALAGALAVANACRYYFVTPLGERVVSDLRLQVFRKVIQLPASFFRIAGNLV